MKVIESGQIEVSEIEMMIRSENEPLDVSQKILIENSESQQRQVYQFSESGLIKVLEMEPIKSLETLQRKASQRGLNKVSEKPSRKGRKRRLIKGSEGQQENNSEGDKVDKDSESRWLCSVDTSKNLVEIYRSLL